MITLKKKKLKKWVIPTVLALVLGFVCVFQTFNFVKLNAELQETKKQNETLEKNIETKNLELSEKITKLEDYQRKVEALEEENSKLKEENALREKEKAEKAKSTSNTTKKSTESDSGEESQQTAWNGRKLTKQLGVVQGPSGKETYYNLNVNQVVENSHRDGIEGDYWVRDDGVKMMGDYILAACDVTGRVRNRYDLVETSLGTAICADTGTFAEANPSQIDIAVNW